MERSTEHLNPDKSEQGIYLERRRQAVIAAAGLLVAGTILLTALGRQEVQAESLSELPIPTPCGTIAAGKPRFCYDANPADLTTPTQISLKWYFPEIYVDRGTPTPFPSPDWLHPSSTPWIGPPYNCFNPPLTPTTFCPDQTAIPTPQPHTPTPRPNY